MSSAGVTKGRSVRRALVAGAFIAGALAAGTAAAAPYTPKEGISQNPLEDVYGYQNGQWVPLFSAPWDQNAKRYTVSGTWNMAAMNAYTAYGITKGAPGTLVGVIDSEFDTSHPDLVNKIQSTYNATLGSAHYQSRDVSIETGDAPHGTSTAGLAAGDTDNGIGISGVGFDSRLLLAKVTSSNFSDTQFCRRLSRDMNEALHWAADNGARVISISMGCDRDYPEMHDGINYALGKDVVIVASAGNDQSGRPYTELYPAAYDGVIAVAAVDYNNQITTYSSQGPWVDISAPGERVWAPTNRAQPKTNVNWYEGWSQTQTYTHASDLGYTLFNGTSAAAPQAAGVAALVRTIRPDMTRAEVEQVLLSTATDLGATGRDPVYGTGMVNAGAAVQAAQAYVRPAPVLPPAPVPVAVPTPQVQSVPAATQLFLFVNRSTVRTRRKVMLTGFTRPALRFTNLRVQRYRAQGGWSTVKVVKTTAAGRFAYGYRAAGSGGYRMRVVLPASPRLAAATSRAVTFRAVPR